jgi:hypothetical protein
MKGHCGKEVKVMELELDALEVLPDEAGLTGGCGACTSWSCGSSHEMMTIEW